MNLFSKKAPIWGMIFAITILPTAISHAQVAPEVAISADSLLCEGKRVTLTASVSGCSVGSYEWFEVMTDGSVSPVDGSSYYHELQGNVLKSMSDGAYSVRITCDDGRVAEGSGRVEQQTDDAQCAQ